MVDRSAHWTDDDAGLPPGQIRRTIRNWDNFRRGIGGQYAKSNPAAVDDVASPPLDWAGRWDMRFKVEDCPLQCYGYDTTDPTNSTLIGVRASDAPSSWINWKAVGVNAVAPVGDYPARHITWPDSWMNADLVWVATGHSASKSIILKAPGHPSEFRFSLRVAPGHSWELVGDSWLRVTNPHGVEVLKTRPVIGWDSSGATTFESTRVRCTLEQRADLVLPGRTLPTFAVVPNAADLAGAVYPVTLDPTTTLSGTTAIEDTILSALDPSWNQGGYEYWQSGYYLTGDRFRSLLRVATASIPAGLHTGFRGYSYQVASGLSSVTSLHEFYAVKDANTWVEGSGLGVAVNNSSWNHCIATSQAWAGSVGCGTSGTDYDADATPPTMTCTPLTSGPDTLRDVTLKPEWVTAWKTGTRVNNGMLTRVNTPVVGKVAFFRSTESADPDKPYFEIDYSLATAGYFNALLRRARR